MHWPQTEQPLLYIGIRESGKQDLCQLLDYVGKLFESRYSLLKLPQYPHDNKNRKPLFCSMIPIQRWRMSAPLTSCITLQRGSGKGLTTRKETEGTNMLRHIVECSTRQVEV